MRQREADPSPWKWKRWKRPLWQEGSFLGWAGLGQCCAIDSPSYPPFIVSPPELVGLESWAFLVSTPIAGSDALRCSELPCGWASCSSLIAQLGRVGEQSFADGCCGEWRVEVEVEKGAFGVVQLVLYITCIHLLWSQRCQFPEVDRGQYSVRSNIRSRAND